ncbi:MAG: histidine phosphatase family protein [Prolixibacteraceae bacterium]|nr:histidine phosphatase family protein [Burkholderiales bacterium]
MFITSTDRSRLSRSVRGFAGWLLLLCFLSPAAADPGIPDASNAKDGAVLVSALRQGGLVIYFRHADTGPAYQEQGVDLKRCDSQRNLNDKGRDEARQIGAQFKRLDIPVGDVLSSEFCRCKETAELAFGRYKVESLLTGVSRASEAAPRRERAIAGLKVMLAAAPQAAANTVLISHGYNLWDTEGFHLGTQGEAAIFRPDGKGGYALVARLTPDQWEPLPSQ